MIIYFCLPKLVNLPKIFSRPFCEWFILFVSTVGMPASAVTSNDCECTAVTADVTTPPPSHSIEPLGTRTRSMTRLQNNVEQLRTETVSPVTMVTLLDISLPSPSTAASILSPAATCFSPMLLESGDVSPCPWIVCAHEEHADTTDTESVGSDSDIVTSCRSRRCAYTKDSDGSGDEGQCSLYWCGMCQYRICCKCVESVWRVVGITATNGYWRGALWRSMTY